MYIGLGPDIVEYIHDVLVSAFLPFDEKINPYEHRSRALIESAAARPFQSAFGEDIWPTLPQKAAAFFHSLACNHCFINGNKRTAVIGLDSFLLINNHLLVMSSEKVYELAKDTAKANEEGRSLEEVMASLSKVIGDSCISLPSLKDPAFRARLGDRYPHVIAHVARMIEFSRRLVQLGDPRNSKE